MAGMDFDELAARIDGVAWVLKSLIAELEMSGRLDGPGFCDRIRASGRGREIHAGLERSGQLIQLIADDLDAARANRQSMAPPG